MPPPDYERSPITGWTRDHWVAFADQQLLAVRPYVSTTRSLISLPGKPSWSGSLSDGMEGFARTFMLAAFRVAGADGADPHRHLEVYRAGLLAGTNPESPQAWLPIEDRKQPMVEAASVVLALQLTKPWLWDTLSGREHAQVAAWLQGSSTSVSVDNNWVLFQLLIAEFLAGAGFEHNEAHIEQALLRLEEWYVDGGWYRDGDNGGTGDFFDYYCGWAMHLYAILWSTFASGRHPDAPALNHLFTGRLAEFLKDHVLFFGGNGAPVFQGRSLIYRYAAVAPLFLGAARECSPLSPGQTRRIASGAAKYFLDGGAYPGGLPTLGWFGSFEPMTQEYSGPASPYWSSKAFVGLLLPATHPVWTAVEEPAPVETADHVQFSAAPNYLLHSTASDGITRLLNHGSDKYYGPGPDDPQYRRLAYSSHTAPLFTDGPVDNHFAVMNEAGLPSRRSRIHRLRAEGRQAASFYRPVWSDAEDEADSPWRVATGTTAAAGYELRVHVVDSGAGTRGVTLAIREGGYPLADSRPLKAMVTRTNKRDDDPEPLSAPGVLLEREGLKTGIWPLAGYSGAGDMHFEGVSPLGDHAACGYLDGSFTGSRSCFASLIYLGVGEPELFPMAFDMRYDGTRVSAAATLSGNHPAPVPLILRLSFGF
ncbi:DUF2264 domain-containing protein [Pseudarthrobacter sp. Y6]|uniref:DUF2264 domain-containing protein n=1 Tax=Pseudarthrobacter sp. Y6 TaxID=3418422 RepID=UPI003CF524E7